MKIVRLFALAACMISAQVYGEKLFLTSGDVQVAIGDGPDRPQLLANIDKFRRNALSSPVRVGPHVQYRITVQDQDNHAGKLLGGSDMIFKDGDSLRDIHLSLLALEKLLDTYGDREQELVRITVTPA